MNNKLFTTLTIAFLFFSAIVSAQAPQAFSYQAIAANANGTPVVNGTVAVRISVLDNSATGTVLYTETHSKQTNAQGLFNLNIGQGSPTTGTFSGINWGQNAKYVKVELDPAGGTNYVNVGTNQLMSVPYALFAEKATEVGGNSSNSSDKSFDGDSSVVIHTTNSARGYSSKNGWSSEYNFAGNIKKVVAARKGIVLYTTANTARGFSSKTGFSSEYNFTGNIIGENVSNNTIVLYTDANTARGFSSSTGWSSENSFTGNITGNIASNNCSVLYTSSNQARGFSNSIGWSTEYSFSGNIIGAIAANDLIVVYTDANTARGYSATTGWSSEFSFSGTISGVVGTK